MENENKELTSRELQAINTKKKLFNAAMELMKTKGYDNLTVREVCQLAGTSTGNFYNYFSNKEQILHFYYEMAGDDFNQQAKLQISIQNPIERLISFYKWYAKYTTDFGLEFCCAFFSSQNKTLNTDKTYNRVMEITLAYVQEASQQNLFSLYDRTNEEVTKDLCVVVKGAITDWCVYDGSYDLSEYVERLLRNCIKGLM